MAVSSDDVVVCRSAGLSPPTRTAPARIDILHTDTGEKFPESYSADIVMNPSRPTHKE